MSTTENEQVRVPADDGGKLSRWQTREIEILVQEYLIDWQLLADYAADKADPDREEERTYAWRLSKYVDSTAASVELGEIYADVPDHLMTAITHQIAENLIKAGTMLLQSTVTVDGDDEDDDNLG